MTRFHPLSLTCSCRFTSECILIPHQRSVTHEPERGFFSFCKMNQGDKKETENPSRKCYDPQTMNLLSPKLARYDLAPFSTPTPDTSDTPVLSHLVFEERSRFSSQVRIEQGQIDGSRLSVRRRIFKIMIAQVAAHNTKNRMVHRGESCSAFCVSMQQQSNKYK